jgi:uncharacterized protein with FMN-binding domain
MRIIKRGLTLFLLGVITCLALSGCPHQAEDITTEKTPTEEIPEEEVQEDENSGGETPGRFNPGTYSGQAQGYGGKLYVSVTFSKDSITGIVVGVHSETASRATVQTALANIPPAIIAAQRLDVDGISGATFTSNAIRGAVEACVVKAGADPVDLKRKKGD